jgi:hypothetical protein
VTREDVGESPKGLSKDLVSDALKRAAVHFGVGVSVYALPQITLFMKDSKGRIEKRGGKGDSIALTEHGHVKLREGYAKWLEEHGSTVRPAARSRRRGGRDDRRGRAGARRVRSGGPRRRSTTMTGRRSCVAALEASYDRGVDEQDGRRDADRRRVVGGSAQFVRWDGHGRRCGSRGDEAAADHPV